MDIVLLNQINEVFKLYEFQGNNKGAIENLSQINIFIGVNNSGKSRLLRELFLAFQPSEEKYLKYREVETDIFDMVVVMKSIFSNHKKFVNIFLKKYSDFLDLNKIPIPQSLSYINLEEPDFENWVSYDELRNELNTFFHYINELKKHQSEDEDMLEELIQIIDNYPLRRHSKQYYVQFIPIIRTLRYIDNIKVLHNHFIKFYFPKDKLRLKEDVKISTGEHFTGTIQELHNSPEDKRIIKEDFEQFLSETFFENQLVKITPMKGDDNHLRIKIGKEKEYPIHLIGDGIQSIINLTFPMFESNNRNCILFIEEPEINLHPAYQRILLETITRFPNLIVFFTTHSNHFLDMTVDFRDKVSVYHFQKTLQEGYVKSSRQTAKFKVSNITNPNFNLLNELGVRNSSVFLANCTIWVEGITDRFYVRKYLKLYQESLKEENQQSKLFQEDLHFSFIEYGGNNITHWSFLDSAEKGEDYKNINVEAISGNIFLIADNDGVNEKDSNKTAKAERFKLLKNALGDRFYSLKAREIENLVSPKILEKTLEKLDKANKIQNASIFDNLNHEDYQAEKIGEFIDKQLNINRFAAKSGTIKQKIDFAIAATEEMNSFDDLSEEAKLLAKRIFSFIEKHNS